MGGNAKKVLVTPLDWGLGHAARCVPLIKELLQQGSIVFIASSGSALAFLKQEFPDLKFFELQAYQPVYSANNLLFNLVLQIPRFTKVIKREHEQVEQIVQQNSIDIIMSDNRYGCWSTRTRNILISHQLTLQVPLFSFLVNFFHERALRKFSECWIPDVPGNDSLARKLSVNHNLKTRHIGVLSRMEWRPTVIQYELLAIVSGPEPQRTLFENLIRRELKTSGRHCLIVRGLPQNDVTATAGNLEEINHLSTTELNQIILESELILSRSGYSTIMDMAILGKKTIFIPTPGQTEQEYLASEFMKDNIAFSMRQKLFNLQEALEQSANYTGFKRIERGNELKEAIKDLLK